MRWSRKTASPKRAAGADLPPDIIDHADHEVRGDIPDGTEQRVGALRVVMIAVIALLLLQALRLQIAGGSLFRTVSEENRVRELIERAPRGVFLDQSGTPLVRNVPAYALVADPSFVPQESQKLAEELSRALQGRDLAAVSQQLEELVHARAHSTVLLNGLSSDEYLTVNARVDRLPGLRAESTALREYRGTDALSHVLGYTGYVSPEEQKKFPGYGLDELIGKSGLERQYESALRGRHGVRRVEVTARGETRADLGHLPPTPGSNLRLHLDLKLQERLAAALTRGLDAAGVQRGAAVVLDPFSGAVRALVSLPWYPHTRFARGGDDEQIERTLHDRSSPLLNRVTQGQYVPGSTFKPFLAAAALEEAVTTPSLVINSTGGIRVGSWFFPDWKVGGHGRTDIVKALAESVNSYFYLIGGGVEGQEGLGIQRLTTWARQFGMGERTGIDLPGEQTGFLPSPEWKQTTKHERWYIGDTYHAAIGQGDILVTPLQLATATTVIANGGTLYAPRLLDALEGPNGSVRERIPPVVRAENVVSAATAALIRAGMRASVTAGSARGLQSLPVPVAAKTGTAQVGGGERTHAWVAVIAPAENPTLVLVVLLEEAGGGDRFAVPVARDILSWYFSREMPAPSNR